jgi:hypothetical protein
METGREPMAKRPQQQLVTDPDSVPEIICNGMFNVSVVGSLATLTFTHLRPEPTALLRDGSIKPSSVVRARIVLTINNLVALRDLLDHVILKPDMPAPPSGGLTQH